MENAYPDTEEPPLSDADIQRRLGSLYEEYRALYGLVIFRMSSLDRRVPIAGATLTATLAAVGSMPLPAMPVIFFGLPLALLWFLRTTINHARSFEDALRRIEQIELAVNAIHGDQLMKFQSRHPSKGKEIGGRTGRETIHAVVILVVTLLLGCGWMFAVALDAPWQGSAAYLGFLAVHAIHVGMVLMRLRRYSYQPQKPISE